MEPRIHPRPKQLHSLFPKSSILFPVDIILTLAHYDPVIKFMTIIYDLYWQSSLISIALIILFDFYLPGPLMVTNTHDSHYDIHP